MQIATGNCLRWFTFDKNELSKNWRNDDNQIFGILEKGSGNVHVGKGGSRFRFK